MYQYADYLHIISVLLEDYAKESLLDTQNIYIQLAEHFGVFAVHHCGMHCERFAPLYRKIPNLVWLEAGAHSDFHAVRSACENSWLNLRYSPQNLLGESIPEIQENVRSQFSSASFEKRNDFTSMSCVGIDVNTPDQNVIAFCRAIQDIP
mgnify:CR=1 FL=1